LDSLFAISLSFDKQKNSVEKFNHREFE
jgi:hypothetical protein